MAFTAGFRQPYSFDADHVVWKWVGPKGGRQAVFQWQAPSRQQALEYCYAANCEYQVAAYGGADPCPEMSAIARAWGYPVFGEAGLVMEAAAQ